MSALALVVLATMAAEVPVLLEPEAARREASARAAAPGADVRTLLSAAETLWLARDARGARTIVDGLPPIQDPALAARAYALALDTSVALADQEAVERYTVQLGRHPGWTNHAGRQAMTHEGTRVFRTAAMFGSILFSLALAVMMIGGARELLRPRVPTLVLAGVAAVSVLAVASFSPVLARVVMLADLGLLALAHAAISTVHRVAPAPRGRVFLAALVLLGALGIVLAIVGPLPWSFVLSELG